MAEKSVTQNDLADYCGVAQSAVSRWVNGSIPAGDLLLKIAQRLEVPMESLLREEIELRETAAAYGSEILWRRSVTRWQKEFDSELEKLPVADQVRVLKAGVALAKTLGEKPEI